MSEGCDRQVIALQLRQHVEQDAFGIQFVVGVEAKAEPLSPASHVLTAVTQRLDYLFAHKYPDQPDFGDQGVRTFTICDPSGLLRRSTYFKFFLEQLMDGSRSEAEALCELMESKEE